MSSPVLIQSHHAIISMRSLPIAPHKEIHPHDTLTISRLKLQRLMCGINVVSMQLVLKGNCFKILFFIHDDIAIIALICSLIVRFINKLQFKTILLRNGVSVFRLVHLVLKFVRGTQI